MSYPVILLWFPDDFNGNLDELPDNWEPANIITQDYFANEVKKLFPNMKVIDNISISSDDSFLITDETSTIEFHFNDKEPMAYLNLELRGNAIDAVEKICKKFGCHAIDDDGELIDFNE